MVANSVPELLPRDTQPHDSAIEPNKDVDVTEAVTASSPNKRHPFRLGLTYLWRWLVFAAIGGFLQPVANTDQFWLAKFYQVLSAMPFGILAWLMFTLAMNYLNEPRKRWKGWVITIVVWMAAKFIIAGVSIMITGNYNPNPF